MIRFILTSLCVGILTSSLLFGQGTPTGEIYPLAIGASWKFKTSDDRIIVQKITREEKIQDYPGLLLETTENGKLLATEHLGISSDGVYRFTLNGSKLDRGFLILKKSLKAGDAWSVEGVLETGQVTGKAIVTEEEISVPLGKFKAFGVKVEFTGKDGKTQSVISHYASGKGMVKQQFKAGDKGVFSIELLEFTPGKNPPATLPKGESKKLP